MLLRRFAAYCFTANLHVRVRWIYSEANPSDKDSRLYEAPSFAHASVAPGGDYGGACPDAATEPFGEGTTPPFAPEPAVGAIHGTREWVGRWRPRVIIATLSKDPEFSRLCGVSGGGLPG